MRILAVSDEESKYFYDYYAPGKLEGFDLILSCGDLNRQYLEFLSTMATCPVMYVHGNHDDRLSQKRPGGCICIEDQLVTFQGVRILGLGGCYRYREGTHMYTEREMRLRIAKLRLKLWRSGGFDVLVAHAPARGINDMDTVTHRGFECFREVLDRYQPKYFIHGHIHRSYGRQVPQRTQYGQTTVINACGHCVFEY